MLYLAILAGQYTVEGRDSGFLSPLHSREARNISYVFAPSDIAVYVRTLGIQSSKVYITRKCIFSEESERVHQVDSHKIWRSKIDMWPEGAADEI